MTTTPETPARYSALLEELRADALPLVTISGQALTLTFTFDDASSWTPVEQLLAQLSKRNDRELLEAATFGGRFARHEFLIRSLETVDCTPYLLEAPEEWEQMMDLADDLYDGRPGESSFDTFADLVDHALLALQPETEKDPGRAFLEMESLDDNGVPDPTSVDWAHVNLEFFMAYTCGTVDRIQYTYPGHGRRAVLAFVCDDGSEDRFALTAPVSDSAASLLRHYYECHDALNPVPVMRSFNSLSGADAISLLAAVPSAPNDIPLDDRICPKVDGTGQSCSLVAQQ